MRHPASLALVLLSTLVFAGCAGGSRPIRLDARLGQPVRYKSPNGVCFVARYGSLSDGSLHFVKVSTPDGREHTLPQVVSASGVRYTDDRELVWWTHQETVTIEMRDADGQWQTKYSGLRAAPAEGRRQR